MEFLEGIASNVRTLGLVSLLNDISTEMIYPLLPGFLAGTLGAGAAFIGLIEGAAESAAAFLKLFSGLWSDRVRDRTRLILGGYGISALAKPLLAVAAKPWHALAIRLADRAGKGVRTSPRDAVIADSTDSDRRGRAFGYHRAMDNAGAVLGPLFAAALLAGPVKSVRALFWLAAIPGLACVLLIAWKVREPARERPAGAAKASWRPGIPEPGLRSYLLVLAVFTLGNSSDAFLLLRAGELGVQAAMIPLLWAGFNAVKVVTSMPFSVLTDRIGRRGVIAAGWGVYAASYAGFAFASTRLHAWLLFGLYGLFYGMTEGAERALMADLADPARRGEAYGWYNFIIGAGALPASLIFGLIWQAGGSSAALVFGAGLSYLAMALLLAFVRLPSRAAASR